MAGVILRRVGCGIVVLPSYLKVLKVFEDKVLGLDFGLDLSAKPGLDWPGFNSSFLHLRITGESRNHEV